MRADMRRREIGRRLLAETAAAIGSDNCYCISYRWLISFYGEAGFRKVRPEAVPPFLVQRHSKYVRDGLDVGADASGFFVSARRRLRQHPLRSHCEAQRPRNARGLDANQFEIGEGEACGTRVPFAAFGHGGKRAKTNYGQITG